MIITSKDNQKVVFASSLKDKKAREEQGKYLIEGYRSVKDSLEFLTNPVIFLSETAFKKHSEDFALFETIVCSDKVFSKISDTDSSQGVACIADIPKLTPSYKSKYALFLDRVRDPGNLGTIIRTALAVGFNDIFCYDCVDAYNTKVVRSAMSALSRVNIYSVALDEVSKIKDNGYKFVCADMNGENVFEGNYQFEKVCLAIGNEANGLLDEIVEQSDKVLSLPMQGVESLNAGVSASVLMYRLKFGGEIKNN